jgi:hypothetical protein
MFAADEEGIPCLHFLLNDKRELVHDNQLVKIAEFVVASILKDKLPDELNNEEYFAIKLLQHDDPVCDIFSQWKVIAITQSVNEVYQEALLCTR